MSAPESLRWSSAEGAFRACAPAGLDRLAELIQTTMEQVVKELSCVAAIATITAGRIAARDGGDGVLRRSPAWQRGFVTRVGC